MNQVTPKQKVELQTTYGSNLSTDLIKTHAKQIKRQLRGLGAVGYDLILPETSVLPIVLRPNEIIEGIVYGRYTQHAMEGTTVGRGALVATNRRVFLLDHKPLYLKCDEVAYETVSGVKYSRTGLIGTVTLHTRVGDITVRTFNQRCAHSFVKSIENEVFNRGSSGAGYNYAM